jgi:hypothetical protein
MESKVTIISVFTILMVGTMIGMTTNAHSSDSQITSMSERYSQTHMSSNRWMGMGDSNQWMGHCKNKMGQFGNQTSNSLTNNNVSTVRTQTKDTSENIQ